MQSQDLTDDYEIFLQEGEEVDLHKDVNNCKKNPGHLHFIPVEMLNQMHLPEIYRNNDTLDLIKAVAALTVKINVGIISPERPEFWPNTDIPYLFYRLRGNKRRSTGTGKVSFVQKYIDGVTQFGIEHWNDIKTCWCKKCKLSDTPSTVWFELDVNTAAHVVFDEIEASHSTLRLFYDNDNIPNVFLEDISMKKSYIIEDRCALKCVTCDIELGDKLVSYYKQFDKLWWQLRTRYYKYRDLEKFIFMVSHPHGCSKQVTLGQWKDKDSTDDANYCKFLYDACTCPGSSGASVFCVGYSVSWMRPHVHSGSINSSVNISGVGWLY